MITSEAQARAVLQSMGLHHDLDAAQEFGQLFIDAVQYLRNCNDDDK